MFRESLLESSSVSRKGKRWPMATAFVAEALVGTALVLIPLFTSGIIPISAREPAAPLHTMALAENHPSADPGHHSTGPHIQNYVNIATDNPNAIRWGKPQPTNPGGRDLTDGPIGCLGACVPDGLPDTGPSLAPPKLDNPQPKRRPSVLSEGLLVHRVEPVYPRTASVIRLEGVVKLQAVITKGGTIQSLTVVSGHPILAQAALDAVKQWRYRPYILNGEPVEVDTFITVTFRRQ